MIIPLSGQFFRLLYNKKRVSQTKGRVGLVCIIMHIYTHLWMNCLLILNFDANYAVIPFHETINIVRVHPLENDNF